ncbi:fibronectin type III domain-containing protein [Patescibacteria group bacterium]|nr:fibronectin type III domain-containing protein [Patescibacteria group bacterium]
MKKTLGLSAAALGLSALMLATPALAATISTQMDIGTKGSDVTTLQQTFASDSSLYPEGLVTGYFGSLSSGAVKRFQARNSIVSSGTAASTGYGRVGPSTIATFNAVYGGGVVSTASAPIISIPALAANNTGMTVMWNTSQPATGTIYYSTSPLTVTETTGPGQSPGITGVNLQTSTVAIGTTNSVNLTNLYAHTTYYYMILAVNASGQISVTWPSTFMTN